jgi:glycosyltransferase involved in cell wall biosynthesis
MKGIKWLGPVLDFSGYGNANRDYVLALLQAGIDVSVDTKFFAQQPVSLFGEDGKKIQACIDKDIDYDIVVHHYVPNQVVKFHEPGKINIGYSTWETTRIPEHWIIQINRLFDIQIVPSYYNKNIYQNSGVSIPIEVIPHCFNASDFDVPPMDFSTMAFKDSFKFLSVFQWIPRKNPKGLLKAYFSKFYGVKDVVLIIKSYGVNHSLEEQQRLREQIQTVKQEMQLDAKCPPVFLITKVLSRSELCSLFTACDCFVLPTRSEGFGMPFAEASAAGLTVVAPDYGGHREFLKGEFAYLSDYQITPVSKMTFPYYSGLTEWCEPDLVDFRIGMDYFYDLKKSNQTEFRKYSEDAKKMAQEKLNYKVIADKFISVFERLKGA